MNKKFSLIEVLFLIIPIIVAIINAEYSSLKNFSWGYDHINEVSMVAFSLAILGNIHIYWQNRKHQPSIKVWGFVSLFLIVILAFLLYIGNSISHFGF
jgi:hypothetical protein